MKLLLEMIRDTTTLRKMVFLGLLFTIMGYFLLAGKNVSGYVESTRRSIRAFALLNATLTDTEARAIEEEVGNIKGVSEIALIEVLHDETQPALQDLITRGLLGTPRNLEYGFEATFLNPEAIQKINERVTHLEGVDEVLFDRKGFDKTLRFITFFTLTVRKGCVCLFILISFIVLLACYAEKKSSGSEKIDIQLFSGGGRWKNIVLEGLKTGCGGWLFALMLTFTCWKVVFPLKGVQLGYFSLLELLLLLIGAAVWELWNDALVYIFTTGVEIMNYRTQWVIGGVIILLLPVLSIHPEETSLIASNLLAPSAIEIDSTIIEKKEQSLKQLEEQIEAFRQRTAVLDRTVASARRSISRSLQSLQKTKSSKRDFDYSIFFLDKEITQTDSEITARYRELQNTLQAMSRELQRQHALRALTHNNVFCSTGDNGIVSSAYAGSRTRTNLSLFSIGCILRDLDDLNQLMEFYCDCKKEIDEKKNVTEKRTKTIERDLYSENRELRKTREDKKRTLEKIKNLEQQQERLKDTIATLQRYLYEREKRKKALQLSEMGTNPWPATGKIIKPFCLSQEDELLYNPGIDIELPPETPIKTIADGTVIFAGFLKGYGEMVVVDHSDGYCSIYSHLAASNIESDVEVKKGTVVGWAGSLEGNGITGVHLEVRKDTDPVDPEKWLQSIGASE